MRVKSFFLMQQKAKLKKKDVNFMTGSIYNIGFIYFLLRNIYKLKKIKKYYLHAICTYTHAYIHKKHLKIAIILMSVRIIAGI